jgi:hypothetical protein
LDLSETSGASVVGMECHIAARKVGGPRGGSRIALKERDRYKNLILLCATHHKVVDDHPSSHNEEVLRRMKEAHEKWVRETLPEFDAAKQLDDESYAANVDDWIRRADLENWTAWTSRLMGPIPSIEAVRDRRLEELQTWLFTRLWPGRYRQLEAAFDNFASVLQDLRLTFRERAPVARNVDDTFFTEQFYHNACDPDEYDRLLRQFNFHVALVADLVLELTRAANYVCDNVRGFVSPKFRLHDGVMVVESGPYAPDFSFRTHRVEYRDDERVEQPYRGLERFKIDRPKRDCHFGRGVGVDDPDFMSWYKEVNERPPIR